MRAPTKGTRLSSDWPKIIMTSFSPSEMTPRTKPYSEPCRNRPYLFASALPVLTRNTTFETLLKSPICFILSRRLPAGR